MAGGWLSLAAVVGLVVGRVIRNRDRQVPTDGESRPVPASSDDAQPTAQRPTRSSRTEP